MREMGRKGAPHNRALIIKSTPENGEALYIWPSVIVTTFPGRSVDCTAKTTIVNGSARG